MDWSPASAIPWLFDSRHAPSNRLVPRWLFLRALGLIYFSAFFSLVFQIRGLIGPNGVLPASEYLPAVERALGVFRFWYAPTLLWFSSGSHMLLAICWVGMAASLLLVANLWPRGMLVVCFICFLSFVSAARDFSGYQSDGMLLEAGFIALFFAPPGFRPGWGASHPPSRASYFLLQWEWFRIYFESGAVKILSGDLQWRHLTAMDEYYQNGPLPTWIGWYVEHLPHWFHASTAAGTLGLELALVWMMFLPRRWRIILFLIVTPWEIGIILTANYTFLNYLVLVLGFLLLDDQFIARFFPARWRISLPDPAISTMPPEPAPERTRADLYRKEFGLFKLSVAVVVFAWLFYASTAQLIWIFVPGAPLWVAPVEKLVPFRISNQYGLFAVMTPARYEIEFQGSDDGQTWVAYPFQFKPQDVAKAPGIYAPYQPRFDWNLWFASLGSWRQYSLVPRTEVALLSGDADVLSLFASNPFAKAPPHQIRAVIWQYWFTSMAEKRTQGVWWRRQLLGLYAPAIDRENGEVHVLQWPGPTAPQP